MANEKILVIEDDREITEIICGYLRKENYSVRSAADGESGISLFKEFSPQLILLDIMLPKVEGTEVCRIIRTSSNVPIMIISAKSDDMDKLLLLGIGADDYLTKPFSLVELGARVRSHLRRFTTLGSAVSESTASENSTYQNLTSSATRTYGNITIDVNSHTATVCGNEVDLTSREFALLDFLSRHPSQVFTKDQLIDQVWGFTEYIDLNTITVYVGRLREKLAADEKNHIKTVWGVGYKWET